MTYNDIINRLSYIYDRQEARAIARRLLDETFGLSLTDIALGAAEQLSADDTALLERMPHHPEYIRDIGKCLTYIHEH